MRGIAFTKTGISLILSLFFILGNVLAFEKIDFRSKPLSAGKALLSENGFQISRTIGIANFSPELRIPIQLIYNSASEKSGVLGFGWSSPQLESSAYYEKDGVLWTAPWGEKIKFFSKAEKTPKEAVKLELYESQKTGKGFFAPYSDWEANTNKKNFAESGDWTITGQNQYEGWKFTYKDAKLQEITAPSGRSIIFSYSKNALTSISQGDQKFVEIAYNKNIVTGISINGITSSFEYKNGKITILPKTLEGSISNPVRPQLISMKTADLNPVLFSYDKSGYLTKIQRGDFVDTLTVEHETLEERKAALGLLKDPKKKVKVSGKVDGRLLSDSVFKYSYGGSKPGNIKLTNKLNQTASYEYSITTGVFKLTEFSGKSYTIYYFMRYDVAYLGKVRKIVDWRGRDVVNYRYDKLSGNVVRIQGMTGNDVNFEYGENKKVSRITRRAENQSSPEPVSRFPMTAIRT